MVLLPTSVVSLLLFLVPLFRPYPILGVTLPHYPLPEILSIDGKTMRYARAHLILLSIDAS